jgi:hypothetical protein
MARKYWWKKKKNIKKKKIENQNENQVKDIRSFPTIRLKTFYIFLHIICTKMILQPE